MSLYTLYNKEDIELNRLMRTTNSSGFEIIRDFINVGLVNPNIEWIEERYKILNFKSNRKNIDTDKKIFDLIVSHLITVGKFNEETNVVTDLNEFTINLIVYLN